MKYLLIILALFSIPGCSEPVQTEWNLVNEEVYGTPVGRVDMLSDNEKFVMFVGCSKKSDGDMLVTMSIRRHDDQGVYGTPTPLSKSEIRRAFSDLNGYGSYVYNEYQSYKAADFTEKWIQMADYCMGDL